jgi:hypothetical protein
MMLDFESDDMTPDTRIPVVFSSFPTKENGNQGKGPNLL